MVYYKGERVGRRAEVDFEDYSNLRGAWTFEGNVDQCMIRCDLDRVSAALAERKSLEVAPPGVDRRLLESSSQVVMAYRIEGVGWTYFTDRKRGDDRTAKTNFFHDPERFNLLTDLSHLSEVLQVPSLQFGICAADDAIEYSYYEDGEVVETFVSYFGGRHTQFLSSRRKIKKRKDRIDAQEFADTFLFDIDALFGVGGFTLKGAKQGGGRVKSLPAGYESIVYLYRPEATEPKPKRSKTPKTN